MQQIEDAKRDRAKAVLDHIPYSSLRGRDAAHAKRSAREALQKAKAGISAAKEIKTVVKESLDSEFRTIMKAIVKRHERDARTYRQNPLRLEIGHIGWQRPEAALHFYFHNSSRIAYSLTVANLKRTATAIAATMSLARPADRQRAVGLLGREGVSDVVRAILQADLTGKIVLSEDGDTNRKSTLVVAKTGACSLWGKVAEPAPPSGQIIATFWRSHSMRDKSFCHLVIKDGQQDARRVDDALSVLTDRVREIAAAPRPKTGGKTTAIAGCAKE